MDMHQIIRSSSAATCLLFASCLYAAEKASSVPRDTFICQSRDGEPQHCPANTRTGVIIQKSTGIGACLLSMNWGYEDKGIWVTKGCSGEFLVANPVTEPVDKRMEETSAAVATWPQKNAQLTPTANERWGTFDPGNGFTEKKLEKSL
jgi:hypothetical protein